MYAQWHTHAAGLGSVLGCGTGDKWEWSCCVGDRKMVKDKSKKIIIKSTFELH